METRQLYTKLGNLTLKILLEYNQIADPKTRRTTIIKYFVKILLLLSLFDIIIKQFGTNSFSIIQENYILTNIEISLPEPLKRIIKEFNLKVELYGIPTPPGAPPPPPAPGGGLGWTPPGGGPGGGGVGNQPPLPPPPPHHRHRAMVMEMKIMVGGTGGEMTTTTTMKMQPKGIVTASGGFLASLGSRQQQLKGVQEASI